MNRTTNLVKFLATLAMVMLLAGVWAGPAAAAPPTQEPAQQRGRGLEYALQLSVIRVDAMQDHIDHTRSATDVADEFIADEQADGHNTSDLEAALAALQAEIDAAQALRDSAAQILDEKVGFDDNNGDVADFEQARDTLKSARNEMREANKTLRQGRQEFRQAMREYRQSKRSQ